MHPTNSKLQAEHEADVKKIDDLDSSLKTDYDDDDEDIKKLKADNKALKAELTSTVSNLKTSDK